MLKKTQWYAFAAVICVSLFVYGPSSHAQAQGASGDEHQAEVSEQNTLAATGEALVGQLQQLKGELVELNKAYAAAKGDEKDIL